jgi:hypothetical protein
MLFVKDAAADACSVGREMTGSWFEGEDGVEGELEVGELVGCDEGDEVAEPATCFEETQPVAHRKGRRRVITLK